MLITRFHMMIRNRVVWAIIATGVSLTFLLSWTTIRGCSNSQRNAHNGVGLLYGKDISPNEFRMASFFEMGLNEERGLSPKEYAAVRQRTWRRLAILRTAERLGVTVPDQEIGQMVSREKGFQSNGAFDKQRYLAFVQSRGVDVPTFEEYLRQSLTMQKLLGAVESAVWTAPAELEHRLHNLTDLRELQYVTLTAASFTGRVNVAKADARAFYDLHHARFTIPERMRVRYVTFPYSNHVPAKVKDEDVQTYYDAHSEDFLVASTNTFKLPAPLEKVRPEIEARLRADAAHYAAREESTAFVMDLAPDRSGKRPSFDTLAAARHLNVSTTGFFAINEPLPGLVVDREFNRAAFNLIVNDPELSFSDSIMGSNAVYVLIADQRVESRVPDFDEIANDVMPLAVSNAQREAFIKWADGLRETLAAGVATNRSFLQVAKAQGLSVSTTGVFTVYDTLRTNVFEHANVLVEPVVELDKGELTKVIDAGNELFVAYQSDRADGNAVDAISLRPQLLRTLQEYQSGLVFEEWGDQLLREANFEDLQKPLEEESTGANTNAPAAAPEPSSGQS